jgi:hypothetical protein
VNRWYVANGGAVAVILVGLSLVGFRNVPLGLVVVAIGAFLLVRTLRGRDTPAAEEDSRAEREPKPDVRVLAIEPTGGGGGYVDFRGQVVNYGDRQTRSSFSATVGGEGVDCVPDHLDLIPNQPPQRVRIVVRRPALGDLVPEFGNENATTLYGETLVFTATGDDGETASCPWTEHVYSDDDNPARAEIQRRVWRVGRGNGTPADFRAEATSDILRRADETPD